MSHQKYKNWIRGVFQQLFKADLNKELTGYMPLLKDIREIESGLSVLSDDKLKEWARKLKKTAGQNGNLNDLLPQVYGLTSEVIRRLLQLNPFDVQIMGAISLHKGRVIEMPTGEGKTLAAVFPAVLNALTCKGVHVLTFNDYLAERDAGWMGPVYEFMGASVGFIKEGMSAADRQHAYAADITYLSAKEAGFDYLRDSLVYHKREMVQRSFHYAIIDEADSILLDEARIPMIIAGSSDTSIPDAYRMAQVAKNMLTGIDFDFDEYERNFHLTDAGTLKAESELRCGNIYDAHNLDLLTQLNCAIHAETLLTNGVDYVVRNQKIELVDEFTGRVADRRRWPDGLQSALEAKENIASQKQGEILNSITLQHFIDLYPKVCGMTGTAVSSAGEFKRFYNLDVLVIPPNKPCVRKDYPDMVFAAKHEKEQAVVTEIIQLNLIGRPVLVGTASVLESERLAGLLRERKVSCEVLNARNDQHEAEIITQAGRLGAVTISTNMAGRGADIRLGGANEREREKVVALGGLYVIGTNKYESRRIDLQLRGRAGRQGDPGSSRFFISLEEDLFMRYKLKDLLPEKMSFIELSQNGILRKEVGRLQRIVEGQNLEIKKTLQKYSSILDKQRQVLFVKRHEFMQTDKVMGFFSGKQEDKLLGLISDHGKKQASELCKRLLLFHHDKGWIQYLSDVTELRESIHLRRIGGQDPLFEFQKAVITMFDEMQVAIDRDVIAAFQKLTSSDCQDILNGEKYKAPSATWTYLVNDNPFENMIGIQMIGSLNMQIGASMLGGIFILREIFRKLRKN